jgi:hypothetical protein
MAVVGVHAHAPPLYEIANEAKVHAINADAGDVDLLEQMQATYSMLTSLFKVNNQILYQTNEYYYLIVALALATIAGNITFLFYFGYSAESRMLMIAACVLSYSHPIWVSIFKRDSTNDQQFKDNKLQSNELVIGDTKARTRVAFVNTAVSLILQTAIICILKMDAFERFASIIVILFTKFVMFVGMNVKQNRINATNLRKKYAAAEAQFEKHLVELQYLLPEKKNRNV